MTRLIVYGYLFFGMALLPFLLLVADANDVPKSVRSVALVVYFLMYWGGFKLVLRTRGLDLHRMEKEASKENDGDTEGLRILNTFPPIVYRVAFGAGVALFLASYLVRDGRLLKNSGMAVIAASVLASGEYPQNKWRRILAAVILVFFVILSLKGAT